MTSRPVVLLARSALLPALAETDAIIVRSRESCPVIGG